MLQSQLDPGAPTAPSGPSLSQLCLLFELAAHEIALIALIHLSSLGT